MHIFNLPNRNHLLRDIAVNMFASHVKDPRFKTENRHKLEEWWQASVHLVPIQTPVKWEVVKQ